MSGLKAVVFGVSNVLENGKRVGGEVFDDVLRLMRYLQGRGVQCVTLSNSSWTHTATQRSLRVFFEEEYGVSLLAYTLNRDGFPPKQSAAALTRICELNGWCPNELLYVGNTQEDMQSAVNGGVLFLNALWYSDSSEYGVRLDTPRDLARFVDVFCLRDHWWYFQINQDGLQVYTLAPYSTHKDTPRAYSQHFLYTVKREVGDQQAVLFWAWYLATSLYFSGVYAEVDYLAPYPCHTRGKYPTVLAEPLSVFAKCFRKRYLPDLVIRHSDAIESKQNRGIVKHHHQFNTIHLNRHPERKPGMPYKSCPLKAGRGVLVLDDVLTEGYSHEAARTFLEAAGVRVVNVALLKAINRDYHKARAIKSKEFANRVWGPVQLREIDYTESRYGYHDFTVGAQATRELADRLDRFKAWDWPDEP